ncbi:hypothetical protein GN956_G3367 [Arapaima gigas]
MPNPRQVSKQVPKEPSRAVAPISRSLSIQSLSEVEDPWEGVTLNRCLIVAVVVLVISASIQCLNEALDAFDREAEELGAVEGGTLSLTPEEQESSVWDRLFWWRRPSKDEGDDGNEEQGDAEEKPRRKKAHGQFVRVKQKEKPWKGILVEKEDGESRGKREKERWQEDEEGSLRGKRDRRREG